MRIIAGEFRGRTLLSPEGDVTRPITDRVKQSLFDILTPEIDGSTAIDLFAGTGSMGLECLSRGARVVTFFETDRSAADRLKKNIERLGLARSQAIVQTTDAFKFFGSDAKSKTEPTIDLIFLDPPYRYLRERPNDLIRLASQLSSMLKPQGTIVFRHDSSDTLDLPPLKKYDTRTYGSMTLEFLTVEK